MKRIISATLIVLLLLTNIVHFGASAAADVPTAEDMGGYENLCLTYTFRRSGSDNGRHYERDLLPYTAYIDKNGNIKDFFFDSYLFLPCMDFGPSGARMHYDASNPTKAIDWIAYVDDTFHSGANVDALEKAYGTTKSALKDKNSKAGVFFTLLYPGSNAVNFGALGGKNLNLSKLEDRKYAIKWMIDEQISRFEKGGYKNLDLVGFYWLEEYVVGGGDTELLKYASDYLHSKGLKFIWIPWYKAPGYTDCKSLGFDVVCMQPNLMWLGYNDPNRVPESCALSEKYGMGMEIEVDWNVTKDDYFDRYLNYLQGGLQSSMMDAVKMYYQDAKPGIYYSACYSSNQRYRQVYDLTYKYAKGTLTQLDIDAARPEGLQNNFVSDIKLETLMSKDVDWISVGKKYTGCRSYVDGNGADYQQVDGKELTDGKLADDELTTDWHAFHKTITDSQGKFSITVDLGEVRNDLTHFAAHFDNRLQHSIGAPVGIELSISSDGSNFRRIASPSLIFDSTNSCIKYETSPVSARYVKISFSGEGGNFVFCSEFLVGVKENDVNGDTSSTPEPEESKPEQSKPDVSEPESSAPEVSEPAVSKPEESFESSEITESSLPAENSESNESNVSAEETITSLEESTVPDKTEDEGSYWIYIALSVAFVAVIVILFIILKRKK